MSSTHQQINTVINTITNTIISTSTHLHIINTGNNVIDTSTPQQINTSTHQHINTPTQSPTHQQNHQQINTSTLTFQKLTIKATNGSSGARTNSKIDLEWKQTNYPHFETQ
jgi:hypothetical protein